MSRHILATAAYFGVAQAVITVAQIPLGEFAPHFRQAVYTTFFCIFVTLAVLAVILTGIASVLHSALPVPPERFTRLLGGFYPQIILNSLGLLLLAAAASYADLNGGIWAWVVFPLWASVSYQLWDDSRMALVKEEAEDRNGPI